MKRFVLYKNGAVIADFKSERAARRRFLRVCESSCFEGDVVFLEDMEKDGDIIALY